MKKLPLFFTLFILSFTPILQSCNNSSGINTGTNTTAEKITDIPATTKSKEALASFKEGIDAMDVGDSKKAKQLFDKAIAQDTSFGLAYLMKANTGVSAKEFADYINKGKLHISSASEWEKLYADIMSTYITSDRKKTNELAEKIAADYPDAARAQRDLGNTYGNNKQVEKARQAYAKAVQLDSSWIGGYSGLAYSYLTNEPKDLNKAEENALKIVALSPVSSGAQITLGDVYQAQHKWEEAKAAYTKAIQLNAEEPVPYYALGYVNANLGNQAEARKNYITAGEHDATKTWAVLFYASTYLYDGNANSAVAYLMDEMKKADAKTDSEDKNTFKGNATYSIGMIAFHTGNVALLKNMLPIVKATTEEVSKDLGDKPENKMFARANVLRCQAMIALLEGKYDDAKRYAEGEKTALDSIKDDRKLEAYHQDMGMISLRQKNYADAINHFDQSDPNYVYIKYLKAKAYEASGDKEKAMAMYKETAAFNYPSIEDALIRNEVKMKLNVTQGPRS